MSFSQNTEDRHKTDNKPYNKSELLKMHLDSPSKNLDGSETYGTVHKICCCCCYHNNYQFYYYYYYYYYYCSLPGISMSKSPPRPS